MRKKHALQVQDSVKKVYNDIASSFDRTRQYQWKEFQYFLEFIENKVKLLDLGCGNGRLYDFLKSKRVDYLGVDQSEKLIEHAQKNFPEAKFEMGDMVKLYLPDHSFDVITSIAAFHHLPGRRARHQAVSEMHRVLRPDGLLIITVWNLFQRKYWRYFGRSILSFIMHLGLKYAWNDLWIKWAKHPDLRYYHAFLPSELKAYFPKNKWQIKDFFYARRGKKVTFFNSFNICLVLKKIS